MNLNYDALVFVEAGFKPSVQLPADFDNENINNRLINSYIPTTQTIDIFTEIAQSLSPHSAERARMLVGTFGTGKSDLLLMLCNYFSQPVDAVSMRTFYQRLESINENKAAIIKQRRNEKKPFLVVLLQADAATPFPGFVLHGLQQALTRQNLQDLMEITKYQAAQELIVTWEQEQHPRLADLQRYLRERENCEIVTLKANLGSAQADRSLPLFQRAFKEVTGTEFNIYGYSQPHEVYKRVAKALCDRGTHSGILLVCDEFTEFLRRYELGQDIGELESETKAIENIAERSATSEANQIHFLIASLDSFASASMESNTTQANKALERSGGRFKQHSLAIQGSEELLRGAIQRTEQGKQIVLPNRQRDELLNIAYERWLPQNYNREWIREVIIEGTFPIHPLTTFALPLINRKVAQSQRTMFLFLNSNEGLRGFLKTTSLQSVYPEWFNLVTLDYLFDYFKESIEIKKPDIAEAYSYSFQRLSTATVNSSSVDLAKRILKVVALGEVISDSFPGLTRQLLRQALNMPESAQADLIKALDMLEQLEAIYPPSETDSDTSGVYSLPMQGRVSSRNLKQRIKAIAQTLTINVESLQAKHKAEAIKAQTYNTNYGTHRELTAFYVAIHALTSSNKLTADLEAATDGLLWYVIATSDGDLGKAQSEARELTKKHSNLVIGVPREPLTVLNVLRDYEALERLRNDPQLDTAAKEYLKDTAQVGKSYKVALETALSKLRDPKQWEWFANGSSRTLPLPDLVNGVIEKLFNATPSHHLGQYFKQKGYSPALDEAVEQLIKGNLLVDSKKAKAVETILRNAVVELGLLKQGVKQGAFDSYSVIEPDGRVPKSLNVWELMRTHLTRQKSWADLVTTLRKPPYGMYDSLLSVFTAAFFNYYRETVDVKNANLANQGFLNIDGALIKKMLDQPHIFSVRYQPLEPGESQWLRGMLVRGLQSPDQGGTQGMTLRAHSADQLRQWIKRLAFPLFVETLEDSVLQDLYPNADSQLIKVVRQLILAKTLEADVLTTIPHDLGMPTDHTAWNQTIVEAGLQRFESICRMINGLPKLLHEYAINRVATIFGADPMPFDADTTNYDRRWDAVYRWRMSRKFVQVSGLAPYPRDLFRLTNYPSGSIQTRLLDEFARTISDVNSDYQRWTTFDKLKRVIDEISKAKKIIDEQWEQSAPAEEVWRKGIATAALGREPASVKDTVVAQYLAEWSTHISWPIWIDRVTLQIIQEIYSNLSEEQAQDLLYVLRRLSYDSNQWQNELTTTLPNQFGAETWHNADVKRAIIRFEQAIKHANIIDLKARNHIVNSITQLFGNNSAPKAAIQTWLLAHPVIVTTDVSVEAQQLLKHLNDKPDDLSTLILTTLPQSLPQLRKPYQEWADYAIFEYYFNQVQRAVHEITGYIPVDELEYQWLTMIESTFSNQPFTPDTRDKSRLIPLVYQKLLDWRAQQQLPRFINTLDRADLNSIIDSANQHLIDPILLILKTQARDVDLMAEMLLIRLPESLHTSNNKSRFSIEDIQPLLDNLERACIVVSQLSNKFKQLIYKQIKDIFGFTQGDFIKHLYAWRDAHILMTNDSISTQSKEFFKLLHTNGDPMLTFLNQIPKTFHKVGLPYDQWTSWDLYATYSENLRAAVEEIELYGEIKDSTPAANEVWAIFKRGFDTLTVDEQRWLIKQFSQELRG